MNAARKLWRVLVEIHNYPFRRPYWKLTLLAPVFLLYVPASLFVQFVEERL